MPSFLHDVIEQVIAKHQNLNNHIFIVPSQRAKLFLKKTLLPKLQKPTILPEIYSIEGFLESLSLLKRTSQTELIFQLYQAYHKLPLEEKEDFASFLKWGRLLLNDFNDIDNYLATPESLFSYVIDIHKIQKWGLDNETPLVKNYLHFWKQLPQLYADFTSSILKSKTGYPGLIAKKALENTPSYLQQHNNKHFIFIGFNALSTVEERIFQNFLEYPQNEIFWDLDEHFLNEPNHNASFYIQKHQKTWSYFKKHQLQGISNYFQNQKQIEIIGVPGGVAQAKKMALILNALKINLDIEKTAVVLADETLLNPVLNAIPTDIPNINITMGYPLNQSALASFFSLLFEMHSTYSGRGWYHQTVVSLLSNPFANMLLKDGDTSHAQEIINSIQEKNSGYLLPEFFSSISVDSLSVDALFQPIKQPKKFIDTALSILFDLKERTEDEQQLEQLYRFCQLFQQLKYYTTSYNFIGQLKALQRIYQELLSLEKLDFRGEPVSGLQIMGLLESRTLHFDTVIITSVNEGILPAGKANNSLLPFDVKSAFGIPTHNEKDAVFAYHFFRLLQRAKNCYLIYNTEADQLIGGEKSRFLLQLLADEKINPYINSYTATPDLKSNSNALLTIQKTALLQKQMATYAAKGFSPSALTSYIRNPIDFYKRNILGIQDYVKVEEQIEANTFGTVIHDALEAFYKPFVGAFLERIQLEKRKSEIESIVLEAFVKKFPKEAVASGKSLIVYQVLMDYVKRFVEFEITQLEKHQIKLVALEIRITTELKITQIPFPITLKGYIDRIDEIDGQLRIIDYKTGNVTPSEVEIIKWDDLIKDYKHSKAFQLLTYAFLYHKIYPTSQIQAGILSTKQIKQGVYLFARKAHSRAPKNTIIDAEVLLEYETALQTLLVEICNPEIPFVEKEV